MSFTKEHFMMDYLRNVHNTAKSIQRNLEHKLDLKEVKLTVASSSKDVSYHYTVHLITADGTWTSGMGMALDDAVDEAVHKIEK